MPILHWLNREESIKETARVPYRLLKADPKLSYGDDYAENMLDFYFFLFCISHGFYFPPFAAVVRTPHA